MNLLVLMVFRSYKQQKNTLLKEFWQIFYGLSVCYLGDCLLLLFSLFKDSVNIINKSERLLFLSRNKIYLEGKR